MKKPNLFFGVAVGSSTCISSAGTGCGSVGTAGATLSSMTISSAGWAGLRTSVSFADTRGVAV